MKETQKIIERGYMLVTETVVEEDTDTISQSMLRRNKFFKMYMAFEATIWVKDNELVKNHTNHTLEDLQKMYSNVDFSNTKNYVNPEKRILNNFEPEYYI